METARLHSGGRLCAHNATYCVHTNSTPLMTSGAAQQAKPTHLACPAAHRRCPACPAAHRPCLAARLLLFSSTHLPSCPATARHYQVRQGREGALPHGARPPGACLHTSTAPPGLLPHQRQHPLHAFSLVLPPWFRASITAPSHPPSAPPTGVTWPSSSSPALPLLLPPRRRRPALFSSRPGCLPGFLVHPLRTRARVSCWARAVPDTARHCSCCVGPARVAAQPFVPCQLGS